MRQEHPPATISLQSQGVQSITGKEMKRYKQRRPYKISRKRIIEMSPQKTSLLYLYQLGQSSASYLNALIKIFRL